MHMRLTMSALLCLLLPGMAMALKSDRDAPVAIQADSTEIDFRNGTRTLTGNVVIDQGSLHIEADRVIAVYKGNRLDTATAWGRPVKFRQLPEGKKEEVYGEGRMLKLEQAKNLLTLKDDAMLTQGENTVNGRVIYYNTVTEKMTIKGQPRPPRKKTAATVSNTGSKGRTAAREDKAIQKKATSGGRTRIIIQPDTIKKP